VIEAQRWHTASPLRWDCARACCSWGMCLCGPDGMGAPLPQSLSADEVLRRYADVLRVGGLRVNGEWVQWSTDTSTELQLEGFCDALVAKLQQLPVLVGVEKAQLRQAAHWFCKAVSINYVLIEVLLLLRERTGVLCTVETRSQKGEGLVEYSLDVLPGQVLRAALTWTGMDNIVHFDPERDVRRVMGTLTNMETEFAWPPAPGFTPCYSLQMKLKEPASRMPSALGAAVSAFRFRRRSRRAVHPSLSLEARECLAGPEPLADAAAMFDGASEAVAEDSSPSLHSCSGDKTFQEPVSIDGTPCHVGISRHLQALCGKIVRSNELAKAAPKGLFPGLVARLLDASATSAPKELIPFLHCQ